MSSPFERQADTSTATTTTTTTTTTAASTTLPPSLARLFVDNLNLPPLPSLDSPPRPSSTHSRLRRRLPADLFSDLDLSDFDDDNNSFSELSEHTLEFPVAGSTQNSSYPYQNPNYNLSSFDCSFNSSHTTAPTSIDLTQDSHPHIMPPARGTKRPASALHTNPDEPGSSFPSKRRKSSDTRSNNAKLPIKHVDLSGEDDEVAHTLQKQREDQVRSQMVEVPVGKSKLTSLQCTVCLEPPTDLTATACGHVFCRTCLMDWLVSAEKDPARKANCPACRKPINLRNPKTRKDVVPLIFMRKPAR